MAEALKTSKMRSIIKAVIVTAIMLAAVIGEYFLFKIKIVPLYNELLDSDKEVRAWFIKMGMCILPFLTVALVGMLAYFKKIDRISYKSKAIASAIVSVLFFAVTLIYIVNGFSELDLLEAKADIDAATEYLTFVMNLFLRNTIGFAVVTGYFAVRANTGDVNKPASADDCDDDTHKDILEAD